MFESFEDAQANTEGTDVRRTLVWTVPAAGRVWSPQLVRSYLKAQELLREVAPVEPLGAEALLVILSVSLRRALEGRRSGQAPRASSW